MCERLVCDFCGHFLPAEHFYTTEGNPVVCNWCFGEMVGVPYDANKGQFLNNGKNDD